MPKVPVDATPSAPQGQQPPSSTDPSSSQLHQPNSAPSSSNKENAFPAADLQTPPRPTAAAPTSSSSDERVPDSQPQSFTNEPLPGQLVLLLRSIKSTLRSLFTSKPPHTIQRLAELILYPTVHYRTLPAYLRALDRVVCVTSSADVFPLQIQASANQPNGVTNGGGSSGLLFDHAPGSDESLGGALLTPIPWLGNAVSFEDDAEPSNEGTIYPHVFIYIYVRSLIKQNQQVPNPYPSPSTKKSTRRNNPSSQNKIKNPTKNSKQLSLCTKQQPYPPTTPRPHQPLSKTKPWEARRPLHPAKQTNYHTHAARPL